MIFFFGHLSLLLFCLATLYAASTRTRKESTTIYSLKEDTILSIDSFASGQDTKSMASTSKLYKMISYKSLLLKINAFSRFLLKSRPKKKIVSFGVYFFDSLKKTFPNLENEPTLNWSDVQLLSLISYLQEFNQVSVGEGEELSLFDFAKTIESEMKYKLALIGIVVEVGQSFETAFYDFIVEGSPVFIRSPIIFLGMAGFNNENFQKNLRINFLSLAMKQENEYLVAEILNFIPSLLEISEDREMGLYGHILLDELANFGSFSLTAWSRTDLAGFNSTWSDLEGDFSIYELGLLILLSDEIRNLSAFKKMLQLNSNILSPPIPAASLEILRQIFLHDNEITTVTQMIADGSIKTFQLLNFSLPQIFVGTDKVDESFRIIVDSLSKELYREVLISAFNLKSLNVLRYLLVEHPEMKCSWTKKDGDRIEFIFNLEDVNVFDEKFTPQIFEILLASNHINCFYIFSFRDLDAEIYIEFMQSSQHFHMIRPERKFNFPDLRKMIQFINISRKDLLSSEIPLPADFAVTGLELAILVGNIGLVEYFYEVFPSEFDKALRNSFYWKKKEQLKQTNLNDMIEFIKGMIN